MKLSYFTDGGYVVHKVIINGVKHSAWFDADGNIKDAERIDTRGRSTQVNRDSTAWHRLQSLVGKRENFADWHQPHCANAKA